MRLSNIICGIVGAIAGSAGLYLFINKKYILVAKENFCRSCESIDDEEKLDDDKNTKSSTHTELGENVSLTSSEARDGSKYRTASDVNISIFIDNITQQEYLEGYENHIGIEYEQYAYDYYPDDDTLIDNNNNIVDEPENVLGKDFRDRLMSDESGIIYVRNHSMEADVEVVKQLGAYKESV